MTELDIQHSEVRDGMQIDWQVPIAADDGAVLRADVYRPVGEGSFPVILSYGPYAKGLAFQDGYPMQWEQMVTDRPDVAAGSTNKYQSWELVDPEKWVPFGYACVRVDSRGTGWSPGYVDVWGPRESRDLYDCVEWSGQQPWSSGKVGINGISYYAINQWQVAAVHHPPHLSAIIPWEGAADFYRDVTHHGGILSEFCGNWYARQVKSVQYGLGTKAPKNPNTGESVAGPIELEEAELAANRQDLGAEVLARELDGPWYRDRSADFSQIEVPLLSAANWGGQGLHPRGNFEGFTQSASSQKWLEVHGLNHWTHFYSDYGVGLQRRFFDRFLKGEQERWPDSPRVRLNIRRPGESFTMREEQEWPLARTRWTKFYLDAANQRLTEKVSDAASVDYQGLGDGVTFEMGTLEHDLEITGPVAAKLFAASETVDADFFLVLRVFDPAGKEVTFTGALDPNTPIAQGWLRASHRKLDPVKSLAYRPWHTHDEKQPLEPGTVYELDVEIWPTSIVIPAGYRLALTVRGKDYEYRGELTDFAKNFYYANGGVGPFTHADPVDRPAEIFGGSVSLHTGGDQASYVLLPIIEA